MSEMPNLSGVESVLGHTFADKTLGSLALTVGRPGWGRLEFLGDAILNVVIFATAESRGCPRDHAEQLVSNRNLRKIFGRKFASHTEDTTGDIVEALIGAVFLDSDFNTAASVITTSIEPSLGLFDPWLLQKNVTTIEQRGLAWIGSEAAEAVVADHLCLTSPTESKKYYTKRRQVLLSTQRLASRSRKLRFASKGDNDEVAKDFIDAHIATIFLRDGWDSAKPEVLRVLKIRSEAKP